MRHHPSVVSKPTRLTLQKTPMDSKKPNVIKGGARFPDVEAPPINEKRCFKDDCDKKVTKKLEIHHGEWFEIQECEDGHRQRRRPTYVLGLPETRSFRGL